jgi:DNA recombination protein RmuC
LNRAVKKYNEAVGSLESRVLVTARQLAELRVVDEELGSVRQVESLARSVQAPVLVSGDSVVPLPSGTKSGKAVGGPRQGDLLEDREASSG